MVGLVVVSHSAALADGVRELAVQATNNNISIAAVGGQDDPENPIGTDAMSIYEAIMSVYSDDGVVVLMDLGSAVLSAEMAVEFLLPEQQAKVRLCAASLVEGAVSAAVQATITTDLDQIIKEAHQGLTAKQQHLQAVDPYVTQWEQETVDTSAPEIELTVRNQHGLHARPAAQFVRTAGHGQFSATQVTVRNVTTNAGPVNAKSFGQLTTLGVYQGHTIAITADGPNAEEVLAKLRQLVENKFGETESPPSSPEPTSGETAAALSNGEISGIPASPGVAIGPAVRYRLPSIPVTQWSVDDPQEEWMRLQDALEATKTEIETHYQQMIKRLGKENAAIFQTHILLLDDPDLIGRLKSTLYDQKINAEVVWLNTINHVAESYRALETEYMQARAADVIDIGQRVLKNLIGIVSPSFTLLEPSIIVAVDLTPSDTAQLNPDHVLGLCIELGSAVSHSAILARSLGIPAVVGVGGLPPTWTDGKLMALDGQRGRIWLEPEEAVLEKLQARRAAWRTAQKQAEAYSDKPAITQDGHQVTVMANIGNVEDLKMALKRGAEGVGLLRTEFLYLDREEAPSEEEQFETYQSILKTLGDRPLIIRTLDIGGDKMLPYVNLPQEDNPFLGWRGIRLCLDRPELFEPQLRAILRASVGHRVKIMFPMVSTVDEIRQVKQLLQSTRQALRDADIPFNQHLELGVMIEVPSAVAVGEQLAAEVDFFSIGTNDLSQYTMAADRTNSHVAGLADAFQPAVLRLIQQTIAIANDANIEVGLCGELAGNPLATPLLLGFGLDEFSMSAPAIPLVKQKIAQLTLSDAQQVAQTVLTLDSAAAVRAYLESLI